MADEQTLTDDELIAVSQSGDSALLRKLTAEERARLTALMAKTTSRASDSLSLAVASKVPAVTARVAGAAAASQSLPRTVGSIARLGTMLGEIGHGLYTGHPYEAIMSPLTGWSAGKGGYYLGQAAQQIAKPIASAAQAATPYAQGLTSLSGAQGFNELAQMLEPNRQDIGFLGVGGHPDMVGGQSWQDYNQAHPALINELAAKIAAMFR